MTKKEINMVEVRMLKQTFYGDEHVPSRTFYAGEVYKVPEEVSARWIQRKIAEVSVTAVPLKEDAGDTLPDLGFSGVPGMKDLLSKKR